jgi:Protein kinase domain
MTLPTEDAVRRQLTRLQRNESSAAEVVAAIGQLSGFSRESRWLVSETLTKLQRAGELSADVAPLLAPFVVTRTQDGEGSTVDLVPEPAKRRAVHPRATAAITPGRVLRERYVIQERLGTGGKGTVFRALDRFRASLPQAQQYVALKILHAGSDCPEETMASLRRELHAAQALSHRNIVNVFEMDCDDDVVFFTMELLEGELLSTLMARLRPARLRRSQAWQIIGQLGAGVADAHARGIVHGDLKPQNIWVTREGEIRILDFGAAQKFTRTEPRAGHPDFAPVSGTPAYASCEQLEGRAADPRDDLYALSCISFELLTGQHPFDSRPATLVRDFGVMAERPPGLAGRQWRALHAGLSWHRAGRSMSVQAWLRRLTVAVADAAAPSPLDELVAAVPPPPRMHSPLAALAFAVLLAVGICAVQLRPSAEQKGGVTTGSMADAAQPLPAAVPAPGEAVAENADAPLPAPESGIAAPAAAKPALRTAPPAISVEGYQVHAGNRFVELRVHRSQVQKNTPFLWWTEPATALQGVDYVHQAKAVQTFPSTRHSTRIYVKLLPDSVRARRDYFYVAIAQPGHEHGADKVTRTQVWLPVPRDQLQASR